MQAVVCHQAKEREPQKKHEGQVKGGVFKTKLIKSQNPSVVTLMPYICPHFPVGREICEIKMTLQTTFSKEERTPF